MVSCRLDNNAARPPRHQGWRCQNATVTLPALLSPPGFSAATGKWGIEMPTVTWDHVHLRSPDPEATAAWLQDILGGEIIRGPGRIDVKLGGAMCSSHP